MIKSLLIACAVGCLAIGAAANERPQQASSDASRYTFSWPLVSGALKPRGGTTKGPPVILDLEPSRAWRAIQAPGLTALERDRRAILAMAGTFRVTFDFLEIAQFADKQQQAPYQSWATEKVYVDADEGSFISLVHILEMRFIDEDGNISEPMVTKHWRQDWRYEPAHLVMYQGNHTWTRHKLDTANQKHTWSQTVYQVDESPRYASTGRWIHTASFSTWLSDETLRPLPRREWSVRDDYEALVGTNRHTVHATGWLQEENNLKAVLTEGRALDTTHPYVAREYGVARYERIRDQDFAAADAYYNDTKAFWDQVRDRWNEIFVSQGNVSLKGPVDKLGLFKPLFEQADAIQQGRSSAGKKSEAVIEAALEDMGASK